MEMPYSRHSLGIIINPAIRLALDNNSPRSRKKPWWSAGRWWRHLISVSSSTGSWQWKLTWAILYRSTSPTLQRQAVADPWQPLTFDSCWSLTAADPWQLHALATAFVASCINYYNGVFYGVTKGEVQRVQMVLNAAARLIVGTGRFSHVTSIRRDVHHWLPVQYRISYKIAILTRDCIHGTSPAYFGDVCSVHSGDWHSWTKKPAFSDAWRSFDPLNTNKIGRTEFLYICTDGVELTSIFSLKHSATSHEHFRQEW